MASNTSFKARIELDGLLRELTRRYVLTAPMTDEAVAAWLTLRETAKIQALTRSEVEVAAHLCGMWLHEARARRALFGGDPP